MVDMSVAVDVAIFLTILLLRKGKKLKGKWEEDRKASLHTRHIGDGDGRPLQLSYPGVNADLVLAAGGEVVEALARSPAPKTHFLPLAICNSDTGNATRQFSVMSTSNSEYTFAEHDAV